MKAAIATAILLLLIGASPVSAGDVALKRGDYWTMWTQATHRQCPGNELQWVGMSDDALNLLGGFDATLSRAQQKHVTAIVDNRCRDEWGGFTCDLAVSVDAYHRLGLLKSFVVFSCESYDCYGEICHASGKRHSPVG